MRNHFSPPSRSTTMMKFAALFLVALLGVANANLQEDIAEIKALIPVAEIRALTVDYAANDAEFQIAVAYLKSDSFHAIVDAIHETAEWQEFVAFLSNAGVDIVGFIKKFYELVGIERSAVRDSARPSTKSFHGWLNEVMALIPFTEIRALINEKRETSEEFKAFWEILGSEKAQTVVAAVVATPEYQDLLNKGRDHGVPIDAWRSIIYGIFGWTLE